MEKKKNYSLNLVLVGESRVGKTSFLNRLLGRRFEEYTNPTSNNNFFELLEFNLQNYNIKIKIWDTAGQERFRAECGSTIKKADIIIYLRDNRKEDNLDYWLDFLNDNADIESDDIKIFFCLNKIDLLEKNEKDEIYEILLNKAQKYKASVFAFSCKNDNDFENIKLHIQNFSISLINNAINSHKEEFNICLIGPSLVGKTSLIERLINNDFIPSTVMTQKLVKNSCYVDLINNCDIKYNYYDMPGQEKIMKEEMNTRILKKIDIIIFVNDNQHKKLEVNIVSKKFKNLKEKNIIICVNKSDLIKNKADFIKEFLNINKGILINNEPILVSALNNEGIEELKDILDDFAKKKFDSKVVENKRLTSVERPLNGVMNLENYEEVEQKKKIAGKNFVI